MASQRIISSDNHVMEPGDLWLNGAGAKFKDRMPHLERLEDGDWWFYDGYKVTGLGPGSNAGLRFDEPEKMTLTKNVEEVRPGGWIPEEHVKDMDADGIDVSIVYPTVGLFVYNLPDSGLLNEVFRIYNDWLADLCNTFPDRIKGIACINLDDVKLGVKELERCANMGLAGGMITVYPRAGEGYYQPEYEHLWAAAQDLQMPLSLHLATNRSERGQEFVWSTTLRLEAMCNVDHWVRMSLAGMIYSSVFERFPKLQVGSVEMELGWIPHFLDRLDYTYSQRTPRDKWWDNYRGGMLPSECFHRNVFCGFQEDALGIRLRDIIGVDNLMWGSDYPHTESTFPRSRHILGEILSDFTQEEAAKIVGGNAARIYNLN